LAIAESLLEEIVLKEYANPTGGYTGTNRSLYDDVDDYNGYTAAGIVDGSGAAVSGLTGYSISPAVTVTTTLLGTLTVKQIVVSVTGPQGAISLTGYRGNY
jgi:MSHA pilin protein MshD